MADMKQFAVTVWKDGGWKVWGVLDAHYSRFDPDYLVDVNLQELIDHATAGGTDKVSVLAETPRDECSPCNRASVVLVSKSDVDKFLEIVRLTSDG